MAPRPQDVLACPMQPNDAKAATIRDYLVALLKKVWQENECFNGKRPFGNSGWEYDLYAPMVAAGLVAGEIDEDGCLVDMDDRAAHDLIAEAIKALGKEG